MWSDNTYGGISLQALVRKEMEKFPELNLVLIDSRHEEDEWLEANPKVKWVNYCGLKSSKYYDLAQKYMPNGSCVDGVGTFYYTAATNKNGVASPKEVSAKQIKGIRAVSYTHLDVYKRQPIDIKAVMAEIKDLEAKREELDVEIEGYLKELGLVD